MNILFLGERKISQNCIKLFFDDEFKDEFTISAIVTNADFYSGFKSEFMPDDSLLFIPNNARNEESILQAISEHKIDILISVQHNWILPQKVLDAVKNNAFNLHNAKLPNYKGYNSISHSIINHDKIFYSIIHWMDQEVDSGDLIIEGQTEIYTNDTALSLYERTVAKSSDIFRCFLRMLKNDSINRYPMENGGHFYRRNDLDKLKSISFDSSSHLVDVIARASYFPPHECAYIAFNNTKTYLLPSNVDIASHGVTSRGANWSSWEQNNA